MKFKDIAKEFKLPDKPEVTGTTSLKFKEDVFNFFYPQSQDSSIVEFGSYRGHFTVLFSKIFNQVYSIDHATNEYYDINTKGLKNVKKYIHDLYKANISKLNLSNVDVVVIDAVHTYNAVRVDTNSAHTILNKYGYLIYDDYGAFIEVKHAVDSLVKENQIKIVKYVGESEGYSYKDNHKLNAKEGVIAQFVE